MTPSEAAPIVTTHSTVVGFFSLWEGLRPPALPLRC